MSWKKLTTDDIKMILSEDEVTTLNTTSVNGDITDIVQNAIDLVSDMFRGAFVSKSYEIDVRDHYIPSSYKHFVCTYARYVIWQRFPMSPNVALDDARKAEYELVKGLLKDAYIGVDKPEWEHSSNNPENTGKIQGGSIGIPFFRMDSSLYDGWTRNPLF